MLEKIGIFRTTSITVSRAGKVGVLRTLGAPDDEAEVVHDRSTLRQLDLTTPD